MAYKDNFTKLYSTLTYQQFIPRVKKLYKRLEIHNMYQASGLFGYNPNAAFLSFRRTGVSSQAQIILRLLEAIPEDTLNKLIKETNDGRIKKI